MAKHKQARKAAAMAMAAVIAMNSMSLTALAENNTDETLINQITENLQVEADDTGIETVTGTVDVETHAGLTEEVEVTIKIEKIEGENGENIKETITAEDYVTGNHMTVDYNGSSDMTTDADGTVTGEAESSYSAENLLGSFGSEGGSELEIYEKAPEVTVSVPTTSVDDPKTEADETTNTVTGPEEGTQTAEGDIKGSKYDGVYDYTTTTVVKEGSVTVETESITVVETIDRNGKELERVTSEVTPDADNDLLREASSPLSADLEGLDKKPAEGYEYIYLGTGNSSQFWAAFLYTSPADEKEQPVYVDENGQAYYTHYAKYADKYNVEGLYLNGEQVENETKEDGTENKFFTCRSGAFQFVMYDPATGKTAVTYCADLSTDTLSGYSYNMENIEEASYYTEAEAEMIRTVAKNGYWSVEDDLTTDEAETGSLEAVKEMMRNAYEKDEDGNVKVDEEGNPVRVFSDEEVNKLTDGMALTATQYAIWTFSNKMNNIEFVNTQYSHKDDNNNLIMKSGTGFWADVPAEERENDSVDLIFKLYEHLINLEPTKKEDKTTTNTIINAENFIENMDITVVEKSTEHENNNDNDDTNDAYVTNLSFALVVEPSTENGDDLVVKVVKPDGSILAEGRVAGTNKEGEDYDTLTPDEYGNYKFEGITLTEGDINFKLTLEGIQNLEQGVYLYSSEVKNDLPSQTMVGLAEGERKVDVEMSINFEFSVEDEVVAEERVWRTEWSDDDDEEEVKKEEEKKEEEKKEETDLHDGDVPLTDAPSDASGDGEDLPEIPEVDVPLADVPLTSDATVPFMGMSLLSAIGLFLSGKRRKDEE